VKSLLHEGQGVRFRYPAEWELEIEEAADQATIEIREPDGVAFAIVRVDRERPDPGLMIEAAVAALREDYPDLSFTPSAVDTPDTAGCLIEFFSLDMANCTTLHCFRTPRRTIFFLGQWSEVGGESPGTAIARMQGSLAESDDDDE